MKISNNNIIALIPAYNEAAHIAGVVSAARAFLPVLVIDDGSTDDTAGQAKMAGATVLRQSPNQGKGAALQAGFLYAIEAGCEAIIMLDGDGQHDPQEIPAFLEAYHTRPVDLIIGVRTFGQMPFHRRLANILGRWSFSWAAGQSVPDNQSGYRLVSRRLMSTLLASQEAGFEFEVEMIVTCIRHQLLLEWIPIQTIYGNEKSHISSVHHVANFLRVLWQTQQVLRSTK